MQGIISYATDHKKATDRSQTDRQSTRVQCTYIFQRIVSNFDGRNQYGTRLRIGIGCRPSWIRPFDFCMRNCLTNFIAVSHLLLLLSMLLLFALFLGITKQISAVFYLLFVTYFFDSPLKCPTSCRTASMWVNQTEGIDMVAKRLSSSLVALYPATYMFPLYS